MGVPEVARTKVSEQNGSFRNTKSHRRYWRHVFIGFVCLALTFSLVINTVGLGELSSKFPEYFPIMFRETVAGSRRPVTIVLIPILGLGNRLRTLAQFSAASKCSSLEAMEIKQAVHWPVTQDLSATYEDLFSSLPIVQFDVNHLRTATDILIITHHSSSFEIGKLGHEFIAAAAVEPKIIYFPNLRRFTYRKITKLLKLYPNVQQIFVASAWGFRLSDASSWCSHRTEEKLLTAFHRSLLPSAPVTSLISSYHSQMLNHRNNRLGRIIGVHFRGTDMLTHLDYASSTANLQTTGKLLLKIIKSNDLVFLAADEDDSAAEIERKLREKFSELIIIVPEKLSQNHTARNTKEGMQQAVRDMFLLSNCDCIWGNAKLSSFTKAAAEIGGIPIHYVVDEL